jgi:cell division protein ZapA (FtsZ GTPase activity inhibitor)
MHQKYTLTISDIEINVISDESPEAVEALVALVDRKMREISSKSRNCSKTEAAILCSLDYCSDKMRAQRKVKMLESKVANTETVMDELIEENEALKQEIAALKKQLESAEKLACGGEPKEPKAKSSGRKKISLI